MSASHAVLPMPAYVARQRVALFGMAAWGAAWALPAALQGRLLASATDAALAGSLAETLAYVGGLAALAVLAAWSFLGLSRRSADMTRGLRVDLSRDVIRATVNRAVYARDAHQRGVELSQLVPAVVEQLAGLLRNSVPMAVASLGSVIGLTTISPTLFAVAVPWIPLAVAYQVFLVRRLTARSEDLMQASEAAYEGIATAYGATRDFAAAGQLDYAARRIGESLGERERKEIAMTDVAVRGDGMFTLLALHLPTISALALIPVLVGDGQLSAGEVVGSMAYLMAGLGSALGLVNMLTNLLLLQRVYFGRLRRIEAPATRPLRGRPDFAAQNPGRANRGVDSAARPALAAESITFRFERAEAPIVEDFSIELPYGDHVAIVGPSGIGKSTLAWLLAGLMRPSSGVVLLGDAPIETVAECRRLLTVVPQEAYVFEASLRDNIAYLSESATDEQIERAVAAVGAQGVCERLGGLDAVVRLEQSGISQGERQLVALARAWLADSPIVVLDEATCHLDPARERQVEEAFMATGRTLIVVAHRMSAALRASRVVLLEGDRHLIGSHEELLERSAFYKQCFGLWDQT